MVMALLLSLLEEYLSFIDEEEIELASADH
jgi:hypothetical protein